MPKSKELTEFERGEIIGLSKINLSVRNIAKVLLLKKSTIQDVITKYRRRGLISAAPRSGRPPILTQRNTRALIKIVKEDRQTSLDELTEKFSKTLQISVSNSTIKRKLHEEGYYGRLGKKKPLVSEVNRKKRLFWCYERRGWKEQWEKVVFSDESRFVLFSNDSPKRVWRKVDERYKKDCLIPTVKQSAGVMVWGCFCKDKVGPLVFIEGTITGERYLQLLNDYLLPFLRELGDENEYMFQDDNAPVHTARIVKDWKYDNLDNWLPWPAQSPDLNPIENLWDILERRVRMHKPLPKNKRELMDVLEDEWYKLEPEKLTKLIDSMPKRVKAVIKSKGNPTKY